MRGAAIVMVFMFYVEFARAQENEMIREPLIFHHFEMVKCSFSRHMQSPFHFLFEGSVEQNLGDFSWEAAGGVGLAVEPETQNLLQEMEYGFVVFGFSRLKFNLGRTNHLGFTGYQVTDTQVDLRAIMPGVNTWAAGIEFTPWKAWSLFGAVGPTGYRVITVSGEADWFTSFVSYMVPPSSDPESGLAFEKSRNLFKLGIGLVFDSTKIFLLREHQEEERWAGQFMWSGKRWFSITSIGMAGAAQSGVSKFFFAGEIGFQSACGVMPFVGGGYGGGLALLTAEESGWAAQIGLKLNDECF